ncbi:biotin--[acetyl-CoA-carboxylase] ligase [Paroceanicella profunda]|uniref:biotin--[biotin carboxyl-carrier protein] ligase n=1 Tax=Paroceanicella profunda TaxID=2579971 RepID=A0A5B8FHX9_9RHOB|nr:biotin--[acetyl-CoA-carboxylase] ligase [Paroceanicella profunda]QDL92991.1 biotin--[acetyl-CoA-carboxylase] ligase [Paroceanicella profunda]
MTVWPEGVRRILLDEVDSTNSEAQRMAAGGERGPAWICARRQTAGRGRRGRGWQAPEGNFSASLLMEPQGTPAEAALRSFTAALALREAFEAVTGRPALFSLKWPNDVLMSGRKIAGILLERSGTAGPLIVGIGVNLRHAPPAASLDLGALPPVALADCGVQVTAEAFLAPLATAFARREALFLAEGFAPLRAEWLGFAARLGETVTARLPGRSLTGIFETVDAAGALVLNTGTARHEITAADIQFS